MLFSVYNFNLNINTNKGSQELENGIVLTVSVSLFVRLSFIPPARSCVRPSFDHGVELRRLIHVMN